MARFFPLDGWCDSSLRRLGALSRLPLLGLWLVGMTCLPSVTFAEDWPEWRGTGREGVWNEEGIIDKFPEEGLKPVWRKSIGSGYSAPVVSDGKVVTLDYLVPDDGERGAASERVVCLDEQTGETLWINEWRTDYSPIMKSYRTGPRAAPTIDDELVYAFGAAGELRCVKLQDGELVWSRDAREQYGLEPPVWGTSTAPIVEGDLVVFATGGRSGTDQVRAFDKRTGNEAWSACPADYDLGYSQFIVIEQAGMRQLIYWGPRNLTALDPATGRLLWEVPMRCQSQMSIATPVKSENKLLVSSFYNGSMLVEMDASKPTAQMLWHVQGKGERPDQTEGLHCVITTPVIDGEHFFGTCSYGELRGLELKDSSRIWENKELTRQGRWGSAYFVKQADRYFMFNDAGELSILRLTASGAELIDRTQLIEPDTEAGYGPRRWANSMVNWCHPAFANQHIIVRNDHEIIRVSLAR